MSDRAAQTLKQTLSKIQPVDTEIATQAQKVLDNKTKPRGSLGRLEEVACRICAIRGAIPPNVADRAIVVMAADHGVATEGVSAYPQVVTHQMLLNFARGGAAINVLAQQACAQILVVDMGVVTPVNEPTVRSVRIGPGTKNIRRGPAMTRGQALAAVAEGVDIANELADAGVGVVGIGEMGIANTTASSAMASFLTGLAPEELTGRGTGIDEAKRQHKIAVIRDAIAVNHPAPDDAIEVLARLGGFEIAGLSGVVVGAASRGMVVVIDGFISSVAALAAVRLSPAARDYLIASHKSLEPGHSVVLRELQTQPLLDLAMRLGEGTGATIAMQLIASADAILRDMASFDSAGVTDTGA